MAQRLVVIRGGAAGRSAASVAHREDSLCEIVVLEATGHTAYGMCAIPHYLAGLVEQTDELRALDLSYGPVYEPPLLAAQAAATRSTRVAV
ncbi:MAG: hypothetical protein ACRDRA_11215 [Pseudonocardiaceae bacterium]